MIDSKFAYHEYVRIIDSYPRLLNTMKHSVGWKQDRMLAGVYLNQKQHAYIRDSYQGLLSVDWNFDTIFREPGLSERLSMRFPRLYGARDESKGKIAEELMNRVISWQSDIEDECDY